MTENQIVREAFKSACLVGANFEQLIDSLSTQAKKIWLERCTVSNTCKYCNKPLDFDTFHIKIAYWQPYWHPVHKSCHDKEWSLEVIECQTIDADCNDCKHFKRGTLVREGSFSGLCTKYNKPTFGHPNFSTGHKCFEHRKTVV